MSHQRTLAARRTALAVAAAVITSVATLGLAQPASAANFCVGSHPMCPTPNQYDADAAGLQQALFDANNNTLSPGADIVWVGAGVYEPTTSIAVNGASAGLQIIGEGVGETVIKQAANNISGLSVLNNANHAVTVSGLTSHLQGWGLGAAFVGTNVDFSNIEAIADSSVGSTRGMYLGQQSTLTDSHVKLTGLQTTGVYAEDSVSISDSTFESTDGQSVGIQQGGLATRTVDRVTLNNVRRGITWDQGLTEVANTVVTLSTYNGAVGISAENPNNYNGSVELLARNVTVVGSGTNQTGINVAGTGDSGITETGDGVVFDSLVHLTGSGSKTLRCTQQGDATSAALASSYVATDPTRISRTGSCSGSDSDTLDTTVSAPQFTFPAVGDYRPATGSSVIDAGNPSSLYTPADLDADSLSREVDGDNNASVLIDIGAHEFQAAMAPSKSQITRSPSGNLGVGELFSISAEAHEPDGGAVDFAWDFGDGNDDTGNNLQHSYSSPGIYTMTVTATDDELETSTTSHKVQVVSQAPTTPTIDCDKTEAIRGEAVTCSASGSTDSDVGDDVDYHWTYTGGGTAVTESDGVEVTPSATNMSNDPGPTTYEISVRAVDSYGTESSPVTHEVTIKNRLPVVTGISKSKPTGFRGEELTFQAQVTDTESDPTYKTWDVGDGSGPGSSTVSNIATASYTTLGTKNISVTAIDPYDGQAIDGDAPGFGQTTVEIVNRDPQLGALSHSGNLLAQDAQTFTLPATDGDGDPLAYTWNYGDGQSETTGANGATQHAYSAPGNYTVTASVSDGFGSTVVAQRTITIVARQAVITLGKPNKSFWLRSKGFTLGGKSPYAYIPVKSSEPVSLSISLTHVKGGYKKGTKCVKKKSGRKRCNLKLAGTAKLDLLGNSDRLMFGGKWRGKNLKPGKYIVTVKPADGGPSKSVTIKLIKKKKK